MKDKQPETEIIERLRFLCSKSEKCPKDISDKLRQWNFDGDAGSIIKILKEEGFINEQRYTSSVVNDKIKFAKWGKAKVKYFLKGKGISEKLIENCLAAIPEENYETVVFRELEKKNKSIKGDDTYKRNQKLYAFGYSRGYDAETISKYIEKLP